MAYYVNRNISMTWWERSYIPEILKGMWLTSRRFFYNLFGFLPFFLGTEKERRIFTVYYPEEQVQYPIAYRGRPVLAQNEDGMPACVACGLCEIACPAYCIHIEPAEDSGKQNQYERWPPTRSYLYFCSHNKPFVFFVETVKRPVQKKPYS